MKPIALLFLTCSFIFNVNAAETTPKSLKGALREAIRNNPEARKSVLELKEKIRKIRVKDVLKQNHLHWFDIFLPCRTYDNSNHKRATDALFYKNGPWDKPGNYGKKCCIGLVKKRYNCTSLVCCTAIPCALAVPAGVIMSGGSLIWCCCSDAGCTCSAFSELPWFFFKSGLALAAAGAGATAVTVATALCPFFYCCTEDLNNYSGNRPWTEKCAQADNNSCTDLCDLAVLNCLSHPRCWPSDNNDDSLLNEISPLLNNALANGNLRLPSINDMREDA